MGASAETRATVVRAFGEPLSVLLALDPTDNGRSAVELEKLT